MCEVVVKLKAPPLNFFEGEAPGRIVMYEPHAHLDIQIDEVPGSEDSVELGHPHAPLSLSVFETCKKISFGFYKW